ncbi:MAG: alpha-amylase family protein [Rikenellaceae bacterium]
MQKKFIIYQVLPRLFGNTNENCIPNSSLMVNGSGKFNDFDIKTLKSIKELGCTHIWFTGIIEHATKTDYSAYGILKDYPCLVKGEAGSPFAVKDYFDVDPDLATDVSDRMSEFTDLLKRTHKVGLKAIIDFIPNHLARFYLSDMKPDDAENFGAKDKRDYSFHPMNNFYYILNENFNSPDTNTKNSSEYIEFPAKVTGNDCFTSSPGIEDWFETVKLNYGVDYLNNKASYFNPIPDTWKKMKSVLLYWTDLGVDGFRCDMAEMVPVEFWKWAIKNVKKNFPETIFIAEIYNPDQYSNYLNIAGFDYLYDKVGLYDNLKKIVRGEAPASNITRTWQSLGDNQNRMLNFLENHDEQRIASEYFLENPYLAIPALAVSLLFNRTPFMIYFGQELGERGMDEEGYSGLDGRTSIFDYWSVTSVRNWRKKGEIPELRFIYKKLMNIALKEQPFKVGQTYDLCYINGYSDFFDPEYNFAFLRFFNKELILVVVNFQNIEKKLRINIPKHSFDFFKISDQFVDSGTDLLSGERVTELLSLRSPYNVAVQANNIRIIKFLLQEYQPNKL